METKRANIKELIPDAKNFNKHSEYGMSLLEKSVSKFGMGRSILLDKHNRIIAGNGITETAGQLGIEDVEIVESDGKKLIAVKRTDIDLDTPQGRELALADNATTKANLALDKQGIEIELGAEIAQGWGIELGKPEDEEKEETHTLTITFESEDECIFWFNELQARGLDVKI